MSRSRAVQAGHTVRGERPLTDAIADGVATISGSKRALKNFQRVFDLR